MPINTNCPECRLPMFDWFAEENAPALSEFERRRIRELQETMDFANTIDLSEQGWNGNPIQAFKDLLEARKKRCIKKYHDDRKRVLKTLKKAIDEEDKIIRRVGRIAYDTGPRANTSHRYRTAAADTLKEAHRLHVAEWNRLLGRFGHYRFDFDDMLEDTHGVPSYVRAGRWNPLKIHARGCSCCGLPGHTKPKCGASVFDRRKAAGLE